MSGATDAGKESGNEKAPSKGYARVCRHGAVAIAMLPTAAHASSYPRFCGSWLSNYSALGYHVTLQPAAA